jgi:RNA polymerase sigma-70 factor (ECF subfamily)
VASIAFRLMGRDDEVKDVVQDVFVELMRSYEHLTELETLSGWLSTVTVRVVGKRLRRRRLKRRLGFVDEEAYENLASSDAPHECRVELRRLYRALDRLGVDERLAWTLRHLQNEPLDVVADRCNVSLATAKRRIAAAHRFLSVELGYG